jgi:MFS family permease
LSRWIVSAASYYPSVTTGAVEDVRVAPLPRSYLVWLSGAMASQVGDAALYFALAWAASARGGPAVGLVLSSINLPRAALLLLGGAVGDRFGARRIMIVGDGIMLVVAAVLAAASWRWGTPLALLLTAGLVIGTVDAFYLPSSGSMPRQLVEDSSLPRALALRQSGSQIVSMIGGPIGGVLVAFAGFTVASLTDSVSFGVVLAALISIRPRFTPPPAQQRRNMLRESADGIRVAVRTPGLGAVLLLVAGRRGSVSRPGLAAARGLAIIAAGELTVGLSPVKVIAVVGAVMMGVGTATFVCNLAPVLMATTPRSHLARVQALLSLAQSAALLVFNNVLGVVAHVASASDAMITCASIVFACALAAVVVPTIRRVGAC